MRRGFWFAAGAATGVYALTRARRAADLFTPEGVRDRLAGLSLGAHLFTEEVRTEMAERENELRTTMRLEGAATERAIEATAPDRSTQSLRSS
ncbi:MAG TPA: DUF6167 family protein [Nocardioidaceae bacterium]|nr:DUF6167 family protein [Nocardioidaceae bacterium]